MNRPALVVLAFGLIGLIAWGLWPRGPETEEDRIRLVIDEMAKAVGDRQVGDVVDHFSESYRGELGDKRQLHGYLMAAFFRAQALVALPSGVEISVDGDRADVKLRLSLAQAPGHTGGDTLGSHRIEATFAREDGVWRVLTARRVR